MYLTYNKANHKQYAVKCVSCLKIENMQLQQRILQEKGVLESVDYPFLIQHVGTIQDKNFVYFISEYIQGMNLLDVLLQMDILNKPQSVFYTAQLILAVQYLHSMNLMHRDIKPENLIVDMNGYLNLVDMGSAKMHDLNCLSRTFTIVGTPYYIAPEMLTMKGYNTTADIWSIGVCLYEFLCGHLPFGHDLDDPFEIYRAIVQSSLTFPNFITDEDTISLIRQLLNKFPESRLGGSYFNLKKHPFFYTIDWQDIEIKAYTDVPFYPEPSLSKRSSMFQ